MDEHPHDHGHASDSVTTAEATTVTDLVCGMPVNPATSKHHCKHAGTTFHFCSAGCKRKFEAEPGKYLAPETPLPTDAVYTCPMHPEIRQQGPGSCPICGMALEPVAVSAEAPSNVELHDMKLRFWIGLLITLPVFILEMGGHIPRLG
jgi:P-type Cu+ transporter